MESSSQTSSMIVNDLEERLKNLYRTRVHDEQTLNDLELLVNVCSNQLNYLYTSTDSTLVAMIVPTLLRTIISLTQICTEKSDIIISGSFLSQDKLNLLNTKTKTLHNDIKEFIKSPKLNTILIQSIQQKHFLEQLRFVSDSIVHIDFVLAFSCLKLIVKLITGSEDQQQYSNSQTNDVDDGLVIRVYESVVRHMAMIRLRNFRDKSHDKQGSLSIKVSQRKLVLYSKNSLGRLSVHI